MPQAPPSNASSHCPAVGVVQNGSASGSDISVISSVCQKTITDADSPRVSTLVRRNDAAKTGAEASITRLYQPPPPLRPGPTITSTPTNPTSTAVHRAGLSGSRSSQAAPSSTKSGLVKPIAVMSASGMCGSAMNHSTRPKVCNALRVRCPRTEAGRRRDRPTVTSNGSSGNSPIA